MSATGRSDTWGSETSQYPEEQKKIHCFAMNIPLVAASETGGSPKSFVFYTSDGCREILSAPLFLDFEKATCVHLFRQIWTKELENLRFRKSGG